LDEQADNALDANERNFYKVEKWTRDSTKVARPLYAGNNLKKARDLFAMAVKQSTQNQTDDPAKNASAWRASVNARRAAGRLRHTTRPPLEANRPRATRAPLAA
jgi:hypothetical protein